MLRWVGRCGGSWAVRSLVSGQTAPGVRSLSPAVSLCSRPAQTPPALSPPSLTLAARHASSGSTPVDHISGLPLTDPVKGDLVYSGPLAKMIKGVKGFSLSTSIIGLSLQPYLLMHAGEATGLAAKLMVGGAINFFVFVTPLLIHFITKKYVTDLYYNPQTEVFTARTITLFLRRRVTEFRAEDVSVPEVGGAFTFILVKGRPLFMDPAMFLSRKAYVHMMGYDKPLEWEMPQRVEEETTSADKKS